MCYLVYLVFFSLEVVRLFSQNVFVTDAFRRYLIDLFVLLSSIVLCRSVHFCFVLYCSNVLIDSLFIKNIM